MKSFKSLADATRQAAATGAVLEAGGRIVNAAGTRLSVIRAPRSTDPAPAPSAPLAPDRATELVELQARLQAQQAGAIVAALGEIVDRLQQPSQTAPSPVVTPVAAPRLRPTAFAVLRDGNGEPCQLVPSYAAGNPTRPREFEIVADDEGFATHIVPIY